MTEEMIFADLKKIMAAILKIDLEEINHLANLKSNLREDLGIDSVESLDFLTAIETLYKIEISDQEAVNLLTVTDAVRLILDKRG